MLDGSFHVEPLQFGLLASHDDIHVMPAAEAVVSHREQTICIGWQINTHHVRFLIHHDVNKARVLMRESIVVLPPYVGGEQII